ncbi:MAG: hypothetical protein ACI9OJ_003634 [Myxococcota bacterium]|jgi:hypothetical protein
MAGVAASVLLAATMVACTPGAPHNPLPTTVTNEEEEYTYILFDPSGLSPVPLPDTGLPPEPDTAGGDPDAAPCVPNPPFVMCNP